MERTLTGTPLSRRWLCMVIFGGMGAGCQSATPDIAASRPAIIDTWVQVFPAANAMDTVRFLADGTIEGATRGPVWPGLRQNPIHWNLGTPLMPDGLCLDADSVDARPAHWNCRGYRIAGDTLWLSGSPHATYLRLEAFVDASPHAWASPHGVLASKRLSGS